MNPRTGRAPATPSDGQSAGRLLRLPGPTAEAGVAPRLIACDIDGTLLDSAGSLRPGVRAAVDRIVQAGVHVVLATGRSPWAGVAEIAGALGLADPQITMQGALYSVPGTPILHRARSLRREIYLETLDAAAELGIEPIVSVIHGHRVVAGGRWLEETRPAFAMTHSVRVVRSLHEVADERPMRVFLPTPPHSHEMTRLALAARFAGRASISRSDTSGVEILAHGTSKGDALAWLAASLGLGLDRVAAIGDAWNDLEMLHTAGRSAAMGNAPHDVQAVADVIVPTSDRDGILHAFAWLLPELARDLGTDGSAIHAGGPAVMTRTVA